jgi:hypothetical protein
LAYPDIEEAHEDIMENCPKCNQISSHNEAEFYCINPWKLDF